MGKAMSRGELSGIGDVVAQFDIVGECYEVIPFGTGHINETYASRWRH
jgi:hypothetical protein